MVILKPCLFIQVHKVCIPAGGVPVSNLNHIIEFTTSHIEEEEEE